MELLVLKWLRFLSGETSVRQCRELGAQLRYPFRIDIGGDDAVAFGYGIVASTDTDSHHANKSPSWAHN